MAAGHKRKRGRPPLPSTQRRSRCITFRIRDSIYERLVKTSRASGFSISEEAERRIEKSFEAERLVDVVSAAVAVGIIKASRAAATATEAST